MDKNSPDLFEKLLVEKLSKENELQYLLDDYQENAVNLMLAHDICCNYTDMSELDERHQIAISTLWNTIHAFLQAGHKGFKVVNK
ncbi:hypothetical protein OU798_16010 [Prolixibacteraceae bacterium Z1-6]|uniref:Uncharacterized protein n=1 Tax=Draconibacterium aestuarii TaxID=2998507 RepID=A0A9X3J8L7_9BACT|nr:hypothetical protein [Prolixibacteraceae bacterium Z1-6]